MAFCCCFYFEALSINGNRGDVKTDEFRLLSMKEFQEGAIAATHVKDASRGGEIRDDVFMPV